MPLRLSLSKWLILSRLLVFGVSLLHLFFSPLLSIGALVDLAALKPTLAAFSVQVFLTSCCLSSSSSDFSHLQGRRAASRGWFKGSGGKLFTLWWATAWRRSKARKRWGWWRRVQSWEEAAYHAHWAEGSHEPQGHGRQYNNTHASSEMFGHTVHCKVTDELAMLKTSKTGQLCICNYVIMQQRKLYVHIYGLWMKGNNFVRI